MSGETVDYGIQLPPDETGAHVLSVRLVVRVDDETPAVVVGNLSGEVGQTYRLEISTDLATWEPVEAQVNEKGDLETGNGTFLVTPGRFYRLRPEQTANQRW